MAYNKYLIRPVQHGLDLSKPSLHMGIGSSEWPSQNFEVIPNGFRKRGGYKSFRNMNIGTDFERTEVQQIIYYHELDGTQHMIVLTDQDACRIEDDGTWSFITPTYTTGTATATDGGPTGSYFTGTDTLWVANAAAGDYAILDADHTTTTEPDTSWAKITAVDTNTKISFAAYYGTTAADGSYKVRNVYTVPTNERWSYAVVNNALYFTNGDTPLQKYSGTGTASTVDATYANKARYCISYANRLILADLDSSIGARMANRIAWSKNADPDDWTDSTAGTNDFVDTEHFIMGLGKIGETLVVYRENSVIFGTLTGVSTAPIKFSRERHGIGTLSPYSIVEFEGKNAFLGNSDFYILEQDYPIPIGEAVRRKFFDIHNETEIKRAFGYCHKPKNEIRWLATDKSGIRRCWVWNYKYNEWYQHVYNFSISCGGRGYASGLDRGSVDVDMPGA